MEGVSSANGLVSMLFLKAVKTCVAMLTFCVIDFQEDFELEIDTTFREGDGIFLELCELEYPYLAVAEICIRDEKLFGMPLIDEFVSLVQLGIFVLKLKPSLYQCEKIMMSWAHKVCYVLFRLYMLHNSLSITIPRFRKGIVFSKLDSSLMSLADDLNLFERFSTHLMDEGFRPLLQRGISARLYSKFIDDGEMCEVNEAGEVVMWKKDMQVEVSKELKKLSLGDEIDASINFKLVRRSGQR